MPNQLAVRLHQVVWLMDRKADQVLRRRYGLPLSWGRLLVMLSDAAPLTQHELARRLNHSDPAVSRQLERMADSGLLTVTTDPEHRRRRLVDLTADGRRLVTEAGATLENLLRDDLAAAGIELDGFARSVDALAAWLGSEAGLGAAPDGTSVVEGAAL